VLEDGTTRPYRDIRNIFLIIQEISLSPVQEVLLEAKKAIQEMKEKGFNTKEVEKLLAEAELKLEQNRNKEALDLANEILNSKELAFRAHNLIELIKEILKDARKIRLLAGQVVLETTLTGNAILEIGDTVEVLNLATARRL